MFVAATSLAEVWSTAGFEASPANTDAASQGASKIRDTRAETARRAGVEHFWSDADTLSDDNGLHRLGSARCYMSNTAPTELSDSHTGVAGNTIADYDNSAGTSFSGEDDLNDPATNSAAGAEDDVGHGRCWIDLDGPDNVAANDDDNKAYVYIGVAGGGGGAWTEVTAQHDDTSDFVADDPVKAGAYNLVYDGGFETGRTTTPAVGWVATGGPTIAHQTTDGTEGGGQSVRVTDSGGAGDSLVATLANLKASTTFQVVGRVKATAGDTCRMNTNGASTDLANQDSTSATYATVGGEFITGAALDTVAIQLISVNASDVCDWDHVAVYEQSSDRISLEPAQIYRSCSASGAGVPTAYAGAPNPLATIVVIPPGPGWYIKATGWTNITDANGTTHVANAQITENAVQVIEGGTALANNTELFSVPLVGYVNANPTLGLTYTYDLDIEESTGIGGTLVANQNCLTVEMVPTR